MHWQKICSVFPEIYLFIFLFFFFTDFYKLFEMNEFAAVILFIYLFIYCHYLLENFTFYSVKIAE